MSQVTAALLNPTYCASARILGAPLDVTLSELALETFFPADAESAALLATAARNL